MATICALALLCIVASGPGSAEETSEVIIPNFTLNCDTPLTFSGEDDDAACFAKCTPGDCHAAVNMFSGQPGKGTCALMPAGDNCKPQQANGPFTLKLNVAIKEEGFPIKKNHNIGGGEGVTGSIVSYHPVPSSKGGQDACFAICQFLGCNGIQSDSDHCQLFKFATRPEPLMHGGSPICHKRTLGSYENEEIAPAGECVQSG